MLYELLKKAKDLSRDQKNYIHDNFENILSILDEDELEEVDKIASGEHPLFVMAEMEKEKEDKKYNLKNYYSLSKYMKELKDKSFKQPKPVDTKVNNDYGYPEDKRERDPQSFNPTKPIAEVKKKYLEGSIDGNFIKTSKIYDPETPEQILKIIDLIECICEDDMSYDSMSIFLYPLSRGASRKMLRPMRLIGIAKNLWTLCRKYDRLKGDMKMQSQTEPVNSVSEINEVKKEFKQKLSLIRERILDHKPEKNKVKTASPKKVEVFRKQAYNLKSQGWSRDSFEYIRDSLDLNDEEVDFILNELYKGE